MVLSAFRPHDRVQLLPGPGRTKQSFSEESNINIIMARYERDEIATHLNQFNGSYGNFIGAPDYHTAMNQIRAAGEMFQDIPAGVRAKFNNDPAQFLEFVQDPENIEAMIEMGLARKAVPISLSDAADDVITTAEPPLPEMSPTLPPAPEPPA